MKWRLDLSPWIWTYGRGSSSSISYCSFLSSCIIEVLLHSFLSRTPECFDSFLCQWRLTPIHHYHNTSTHHQQNQTQRKQNRLRDFNHPEAIITHRHVMQQSVVTRSIGLGPACHVFPSFYKFEYKPDWASSGFVDHPAIKEPMMGFVHENSNPQNCCRKLWRSALQ